MGSLGDPCFTEKKICNKMIRSYQRKKYYSKKYYHKKILIKTGRKQKQMKQYDYLIVGAGLYGAVFAQQAVKKDKKS